jgi:hypothetical protein
MDAEGVNFSDNYCHPGIGKSELSRDASGATIRDLMGNRSLSFTIGLRHSDLLNSFGIFLWFHLDDDMKETFDFVGGKDVLHILGGLNWK